MDFSTNFTIILIALLIDAGLGDPTRFYNLVPHPAILIGRLIDRLDLALNRNSFTPATRRFGGLFCVIVLVFVSAVIGFGIHTALKPYFLGPLVEGVLASSLIAQRSLYDHVRDVHAALTSKDINVARRAVGKIVGRDTGNLDKSNVSRAAIETLAENFSDAVIAPVFWGLIFGLPGVLVYKAINTADSMIGHRSDKYLNFGWAAARLDDCLNFVPARLSSVILVMTAAFKTETSPRTAFRTLWTDGHKHSSPNAGYPEATMAGALGIRLGGKRSYNGITHDASWIGEGRKQLSGHDIGAALELYVIACSLGFVIVLAGLSAFWITAY